MAGLGGHFFSRTAAPGPSCLLPPPGLDILNIPQSVVVGPSSLDRDGGFEHGNMTWPVHFFDNSVVILLLLPATKRHHLIALAPRTTMADIMLWL